MVYLSIEVVYGAMLASANPYTMQIHGYKYFVFPQIPYQTCETKYKQVVAQTLS